MTVNVALAHAADHLAEMERIGDLGRRVDYRDAADWTHLDHRPGFCAHAEAAWAWAVVAIDLHRAVVNFVPGCDCSICCEHHWEM